jgi:hypothetical protein
MSARDEEHWLADANAEALAPTETEYREEALFLGIFLGFLFPPIILFARHIGVGSKHGRAGLLFGAIANVVLYLSYRLFFS